MRRFEFSDSTSNKFWEVDVKDKTLNVTFGKIGTKGQSKPKDFATPEKAKAEMEKLIKEKTGKGYVEAGGKAVKAIKQAAKLPASKKANPGSMGEGLSKAEKQAKAEKVLAMFAGGQWELARGILEVAQEEHWLFEELLKKCEIEEGKPKPSTLIKKAFSRSESAKAELVMLEVLLHLPKELEELQKLQGELGIKLRAEMLSEYWKKVAEDEFEGVNYGDPGNFSDQWYEEREGEITKVEKECEARSKALNKAWREEEDLGKGVKLEMVLIPAGKFVMGSPKKEDGRCDDETQHEVTLTKSYYMGKYEVTQEQWESVMGNNPSDTKGTNLPVTHVSWNDCQEFIKKLNGITKGKYRLPTEAEWEYACRAGITTAYSFGDKITPKDANYDDSGIGDTVAVGSYKPNAFGLYDMHGNVWEWCEDWKVNYPKGAVIDPKGPAKGEYRVLRGGSFGDSESGARSSLRNYNAPSGRYGNLGFRLARTAL
ncbi:MAG: WGR domain-containing protein [Gemmataceae bacterium]|nr:WGR domain-containing protein [Gemmataceae bacterium]